MRRQSLGRDARSAHAAERRHVKEVARKLAAAAKPPGRKKAADAKMFTGDSFQNFGLGLGLGTDNALSGSTYGFNPVTRVRVLLEWIHRGSWIGGIAVDCVGDDMTRAGVDFSSTMKPEDSDELQKGLVELGIWSAFNDNVKWSRLYGGSIAVMMIDGQDMATELDPDTIAAGQFKGLLVLDRWQVTPDLTNVTFTPEHGVVPKFYGVAAGTMGLPAMRIHHSRVIRMEGVRLPYQQRLTENLWGLSIFERLYDRMVAFDSSTTGAAQLVYKSYLRYLKIKDLKTMAAEGGDALQGLIRYVDLMRRFQGIEGIAMIDGEDDFGVQQSQAFSGISDVLMQFGQQLSGALQIPLVRLFGQSPAGLNSSGESDLRTYYDGILAQQERYRVVLTTLFRMVARSRGVALPDNFSFTFRPLWQLTDQQKAEVAKSVTDTVSSAVQGGLISAPAIALKELRQSSRITGVWTNITDEDIDEAENAPPLGMGQPPGVDPLTGEPLAPGAGQGGSDASAGPEAEQEPAEAGTGERREPEEGGGKEEKQEPEEGGKPPRRTKDAATLPRMRWHGYPVAIEHWAGEMRGGPNPLPAPYGYIEGTSSAEGEDEAMDCFVGGTQPTAYVIDSLNPDKTFDEHKVMLGYASAAKAIEDFMTAYGSNGFRRMGGVTQMDMRQLRQWLDHGDVTKPLRKAA